MLAKKHLMICACLCVQNMQIDVCHTCNYENDACEHNTVLTYLCVVFITESINCAHSKHKQIKPLFANYSGEILHNVSFL